MFKKILVPVDSIKWDNTLSGVTNAIGLSAGCRVDGEPELIFMHILHMSSSVARSERDRIFDLEKKEVKIEFDNIRKMCREKGLRKFRFITEEGDPEKKILEVAQSEDVDLIVMGSGKLHNGSTRGRISKFVYGSVTERVIHETPCSILVVRPIPERKK